MAKVPHDDVDEFDVSDAPDGWLGGFASLMPSIATSRQILIAGVVLGVIFAGVYFAWQRFGTSVTVAPSYHLQADSVQVTPQPPWIKVIDVKAEVMKNGSLIGRDLLDPQLTKCVADAFASHSWIAEVRRVSKHHPAKVLVDVVYRKPVAFVDVVYPKRPEENLPEQRGGLPVDEHGVVLPIAGFSVLEAQQYPYVYAAGTTPADTVGKPWGDTRVAGAAKIAAAFGDHWRSLGLRYIIAVPDPVTGKIHGEPSFELATPWVKDSSTGEVKEGTKIVWGHAPGEETPGESSAAQKITRLQQFVSEFGELEKSLGPGAQIDLRGGQQIRPTPRTARGNLPGTQN